MRLCWRRAARQVRSRLSSALTRAPRLSVVLVSGMLLASTAPAREAVTWIESYDEALAEARRTGKPIFLEFRCAP